MRTVSLSYGFMEEPDVARDVERHLGMAPEDLTFFLGREIVVITDGGGGEDGMPAWRDRLFRLMRRNARDVALYFGLPNSRVFEISARVEV